MREHKYRAWDKFTKKMVFEGFNVIGEVTCFNCLEQYGEQFPNPIYETSIARLNDFTLMQFTGLKDKNGKEIYESDIIQDDHYYRPEVVEWVEGGFWLREDDDTLHMPTIMTREIIGNIYENPELLK